jgi:UDP-N-acetylmuramoylalanine--D-glutamate ligase
MNFPEFKGKKVLIMGLGLNSGGVGSTRWFCNQGANVTVTDLKTKEQLLPSIEKLLDYKVRYVLGEHKEEDFVNSDLIVQNPDVPINSPYLNIAKGKNIPIVMEESLFYELDPYKDHVIGVTGTRGKTTTSTLIYEILKNSGRKVVLGGNLSGKETLSLLNEITPETYVVLELSSWQLKGFGEIKKSPHIAVMTNIYPDHLNRYSSMDKYIRDKENICKFQTNNDFFITSFNNKETNTLAQTCKSRVLWYEKEEIPSNWKIKIIGDHNRENIKAAIAVSKLLGINMDAIKIAVEHFNGVPYRLELIKEQNGVTFINDTTSTTPIAGIMALRALKNASIILIAGGNSKNLDLTDFAKEIGKTVKRLILLQGNATNDLEEKVRKFSPNVLIDGEYDDFTKAIKNAYDSAKKGDIVLLSPGCTSFGMFSNEFDRGEKFNQIVRNL